MFLIRSISTRLALMLAAAIGVGLGGCHAPAARAPRVRVRIATGTPGGGFYPLGEALAASFASALPQLEMLTEATGGAVSNVEAVQAGNADLGLTFADVAGSRISRRRRSSSRPSPRPDPTSASGGRCPATTPTACRR